MKEVYKWLGTIIILILLGGALQITIFSDKIEAKLGGSELCSSNLLRVSKDDVNTFKCGSRVVAQWDTVLLYHPSKLAKTTIDNYKTLNYSICESTTDYYCNTKEDFYMQDNRKTTKTTL